MELALAEHVGYLCRSCYVELDVYPDSGNFNIFAVTCWISSEVPDSGLLELLPTVVTVSEMATQPIY